MKKPPVKVAFGFAVEKSYFFLSLDFLLDASTVDSTGAAIAAAAAAAAAAACCFASTAGVKSVISFSCAS